LGTVGKKDDGRRGSISNGDGDGGAAQRSRERERVLIPQPHFDSFRVHGLKLYHYKRRVKRL
jgi:hypothetical protein